jgi:drug/metabolite transporter (DMT)-like permease
MKIITNWILPIILYSGPFIPWLGNKAFAHNKGIQSLPFKRAFIVMGVIHVLAFFPFIYCVAIKMPDALHALILPALTGIITLLIGIALFVRVAVRLQP